MESFSQRMAALGVPPEQITDAERLSTRDFLRKYGRAALRRISPLAASTVRPAPGDPE